MTESKEQSVVVAGPVAALTAEIEGQLSAAGYAVGEHASPTAVVYVAGAPADYGTKPEEVGAYVAAVLDGAIAAVARFGEHDDAERSAVIVAPSMGGALRAGPESISSAIGALKGLVRAWTVDLGPRGIRCNIVLPGILTRDVAPSDSYPTIPLAGPDDRLGSDSDVAAAVAYLVSSDSSYLSGAELDVDGGLKEHRHAFASVLWDEGLYTPDNWPF